MEGQPICLSVSFFCRQRKRRRKSEGRQGKTLPWQDTSEWWLDSGTGAEKYGCVQ